MKKKKKLIIFLGISLVTWIFIISPITQISYWYRPILFGTVQPGLMQILFPYFVLIALGTIIDILLFKI